MAVSLTAALLYIVLWMSLSVMLIFMNAGILRSMPNPALLTAWHMGMSTVFVHATLRTLPKDSALRPADVEPLGLRTVVVKFFPIAVLFSMALALGNRAYMYLSISFIQMVKGSHSVIVYCINAAIGAELFLWGKFRIVCVVYLGVILAVTGELRFHVFGFLCQASSSLSECMRVVLMKRRLTGLQLDALTLLSYYAPLCFLLLVPGALATEMPDDISVWVSDLREKVGLMWILLNAVVAFSLNLATVQLINVTSAITYILCGICKDVLIVSGSVMFLGTPLQMQQLLGYALALTGIFFFQQARGKSAEFSVWELVAELRAPKKIPVESAEEHEAVIEVETAEKAQLEIEVGGNAGKDLSPSVVGRPISTL